MVKRSICVLLVLAVTAGCRSTSTVEAERPLPAAGLFAARVQDDGARGDEDWDYFLTPFVWAPWMEGRVRANGTRGDFDVEPDDIIKDFDLAAGVNLEGRRDRTSWWIEGLFQEVEDDRSRSGGARADTEIEQRFYELAGAYAVDDERSLDVYAGVRRWVVENTVDLTPGGRASETERWWDPFVGLRKRLELDDRWGMLVRGDMGGLDIGDASDFTWQVLLELGYTISRDAVWVIGYRYLDVEYDHGRGDFEYNVRSNGIYTGVTFRLGRDSPRGGGGAGGGGAEPN